MTHLRCVHIGMSRWKENWLGGQIRPVGQGGLLGKKFYTHDRSRYLHYLPDNIPAYLLKDGLKHRVWSHPSSLRIIMLTLSKCKKNDLVSDFWAFCPNQNGTRMLMVVQPVRASPAGVRLASSKREEILAGREVGRGRRVACGGDWGRRLGRASWEESGKIVACRGFLRLQRRGWEGRGWAQETQLLPFGRTAIQFCRLLDDSKFLPSRLLPGWWLGRCRGSWRQQWGPALRCQAAPAPPQHLPTPEHVNFHSMQQIWDQTPPFWHHFLWHKPTSCEATKPNGCTQFNTNSPCSSDWFHKSISSKKYFDTTSNSQKMANSQQPKYTVIFIKYY